MGTAAEVAKEKKKILDRIRRKERPPKGDTKAYIFLSSHKVYDPAFKEEIRKLDLKYFPREKGYMGWTEEKLLRIGRRWTKTRTVLQAQYPGAYAAMSKGKGLDYYLSTQKTTQKKVSSRTVYWKEGKIFFKYVTRASFYLDIPCKSIHLVLRGKKKKTEHGHTFRRPTEKELIKIKNGKIKVF